MLRPILAVMQRELAKMFRQKGRLVSAMVRPLIWLFVIGAGFEAMLAATNPGANYKLFMVPGVVGMAMLFGSLLSALTMVYDKEMGVMRMLVIAPFQHYWIVIAKMIAATISSVIQGLLLLALLALLGYLSWSTNWLLLLLGMVLTSLACAAVGMLVSAWSKTLDNFAVIMNFVIFPMYFLSGALYPIHKLPSALQAVAMANPYTYGVDLLKHALLPSAAGNSGADFSVPVSIAYLVAFIVIATAIASARFSREEAYTPLFPVPGRKGG